MAKLTDDLIPSYQKQRGQKEGEGEECERWGRGGFLQFKPKKSDCSLKAIHVQEKLLKDGMERMWTYPTA